MGRGPAASGCVALPLAASSQGATLTQVIEGPQHGVQERLRTRRLGGLRILLRRHGNLHGPQIPAHSPPLPLPARLLRVRHGSCARPRA